MSRLKLYPSSGAGSRYAVAVEDQQPSILPFQRTIGRSHRAIGMSDLLDRARALYQNRQCPHCRHPVVSPVELDDAIISRGRLPIPGTATLVGFHCSSCHTEWPA
jgi:hypothetical protein